VFDKEAHVIEYDDISNIDYVYVQEECYDDYKALNPDLPLKKKNFLLKAVQVTPWEPYINPNIPTPEPEQVSIVVDTDTVNEEYASSEEGYAFTAKSFVTDPVGYEEYVTITVARGDGYVYDEYEPGMILTENTYTITYSLADGDGYLGDTASYTVNVEIADEPISIIVDTTPVSVEYENGGEGYSFTPKSFTTSPAGMNDYVAITVGENEYSEGMLLTEGTYNVTYSIVEHDYYVGEPVSYTITVTEAEPVPEPTEVTIVVDTTDDTATETEGTTALYYTAREFTTSPTGYENDVVVTATLEETSETITLGNGAGLDIESLAAGTYTITISYELAADQAGTHTSASASYNLYLTIESAAPSYTLTYTYDDNTMTATCTGMEASDVTSIEIPSTVEYNDNTYTVTTINTQAFKNNAYLEEVVLNEGLLTLKGEAFYGIANLHEIVIPDSVTTLEASVFFGCNGLRKIVIGRSITNLPNSIFAGAGISNNGVNVWMRPWNMPTIHSYAFYNGVKGTLHIPVGRTSAYQNTGFSFVVDDIPLLNYEFDEDNNTVAITGTDYPLTVVNIPKTVTKDNTTYTVNSVGGFSGKTSITKVNFPTYVSGDDDITLETNAFSNTDIEEIRIPENIVSSGYAFFGCQYLEKVVIEDGSYNFSGADFGQSAGSGLSPLRTFVLKHTTPPNVGNDLFFNTNVNDCTLYVPEGTWSDYNESNWNNLGFSSIEEGGEPITLEVEFDPQFGSVDDPQPLEIDITNQQPTYGEGNAVFDLSDIPLPTVTCNDPQGWNWTCEISGQNSGDVKTVNTTVTNGVPVVTGSTNPNDGQTYQSVPCDLNDTWTINYMFFTNSTDGTDALASESRSIDIQFIDQNA
jgi:hypothetical protein